MSQEIYTPKSEMKPRAMHPKGAFIGVCMDVIDLGEVVSTWKGKVKVKPKVAFVFRTGKTDPETGEYLDLAARFTNSMFRMAELRGFLETWRGDKYRDDAEGNPPIVPLHKCVGRPAALQVAHEQDKVDPSKTWVNILSATPPLEGAPIPQFDDYTRAGYWEKVIAKNADAVAAYRALSGRPEREDEGDVPW